MRTKILIPLYLFLLTAPHLSFGLTDVISSIEFYRDENLMIMDIETTLINDGDIEGKLILYDLVVEDTGSENRILVFSFVRETNSNGFAELLVNLNESFWGDMISIITSVNTQIPQAANSIDVEVPVSLDDLVDINSTNSTNPSQSSQTNSMNENRLIDYIRSILLVIFFVIVLAFILIYQGSNSTSISRPFLEKNEVISLYLKNYVYNHLQNIAKTFENSKAFDPKKHPLTLIDSRLQSNFKTLIDYFNTNLFSDKPLTKHEEQDIWEECKFLAIPVRDELTLIYGAKLDIYNTKRSLELEEAKMKKKMEQEKELFGSSNITMVEIDAIRKKRKELENPLLKKDLHDLISKYQTWSQDPTKDPNITVTIPEIGLEIRACCYQTARLGERYCLCGRTIDPEVSLYFEKEITDTQITSDSVIQKFVKVIKRLF